jgi:putative DNA primase/helicase
VSAERGDAPAPANVVSLFGKPLTDLGNAERLVTLHSGSIRYCAPRRKWLVWDGKRWVWDETGEVVRRAKATVRSIYGEAERAPSKEAARKLSEHATASESASRLRAMVHLAASERGIPVLPDELDRDPWILNVANGTIDLRTGALREHRQEDLCTRILPIEFDQAAACPRWEQFLEEVFGGDREMVDYVRRAKGYTLTGLVSEQVLFFGVGKGANGKSTLLGAFRQLLGDYATQCAPDILLAKRGETHPTEQADLCGRRLAICTEIEEGRRLAENTVKQLTGGDAITARRMREDFWTFNPTHKFWIGANHKPVIRGTDYAIWRRIHLIPFDVVFEGAQKDPDLPARLAAELPGILAWAVRGCLEWQAGGLKPPARVTSATEAYRADSDLLGSYIEERVVRERVAILRPTPFYADYVEWCEAHGERPLTQKAFGTSLLERGFERDGPKGRQYYLGVRLRGDDDHCDDCDRDPGSTQSAYASDIDTESRSQWSQGRSYDFLDDIEREAIQSEGKTQQNPRQVPGPEGGER